MSVADGTSGRGDVGALIDWGMNERGYCAIHKIITTTTTIYNVLRTSLRNSTHCFPDTFQTCDAVKWKPAETAPPLRKSILYIPNPTVVSALSVALRTSRARCEPVLRCTASGVAGHRGVEVRIKAN